MRTLHHYRDKTDPSAEGVTLLIPPQHFAPSDLTLPLHPAAGSGRIIFEYHETITPRMVPEGLEDRYFVERLTPSSSQPPKLHVGCDYFVLDLTHDGVARDAAWAYCDELPPHRKRLADELRTKIRRMEG